MLDPQQRHLPKPLAELWPRLRSPLRPSDRDLGLYQRAVDDRAAAVSEAGRQMRVLFLGATPELLGLSWPDRCRIDVLEPDQKLVSEVWHGPLDGVEVRDWLTLAPPDGPFDIVLCDAGLHTLVYPNGQAELRKRIASVTRPGAMVVCRLLCPPMQHESTVKVATELWAGNIGDMSQLMVRTAQSMQRSAAAGVRVSAVWLKLRSLSKDWDAFAERSGWSPDDIELADLYRFSPAKHHYTSLVETLEIFGYNDGEEFAMARLSIGEGPLAAQCPVVTFERL